MSKNRSNVGISRLLAMGKWAAAGRFIARTQVGPMVDTSGPSTMGT